MLNKKHVLIVGDDPIALDLSRILKSAGMIVVGPAITLRDAEQLARDNETDAAVLDVRLEGGDTIAVARDLRANGIPFLFQTSDPRSLDLSSQNLLCSFFLTSWLLPSAIYWAFH